MSGDTIIGELSLGGSSRLEVTTWMWRGKLCGGFMKHVASRNYTGGTTSRMMLNHVQAKLLAAALNDIQSPGKVLTPGRVAEIKISDSESIVVQLIAGEEPGELPKVDVRVHQDDDDYTGFTKKGIRFGWDKLGGFTTLISRLGDALVANVATDANPPGNAPAPRAELHAQEPRPAEAPIRQFPEDFLPPGDHQSNHVEIGDLPLTIATGKDGKLVVRNEVGFSREVRNRNEGKFFVYAQMRGKRSIALPTEPLVTFKAVASYEVYCRELKATWTGVNMKGYQNRELAIFQATRRLQQAGLPDGV